MKQYLVFETMAIDTLKFQAGERIPAGSSYSLFGNYEDQDDGDITRHSEEEIIKWLLRTSARGLLLRTLRLSQYAFAAYSVKQPIIENPQNKPGDIDLLLCERNRPDLAVALQCKRVLVRVLNEEQDDITKLPAVKDVVIQANRQRDTFGFHPNYLAIIVEAYGRKRIQNNVIFRGANQETMQQLYEFPQRESLHSDVGVIFIDITQPTGKNFEDNVVVGVCVDRDAGCLDQPTQLTNRIKSLIADK